MHFTIKKARLFSLIGVLMFISCKDTKSKVNDPPAKSSFSSVIKEPSIIILGTVQDAGSPHIACNKACCKELFISPDPTRKVVSIGLIDPQYQKTYLIEATPDISEQLKILKTTAGEYAKQLPDGVFLTHAHIGHYTGLMYFGKEANNADNLPVYAMPKMADFLKENGPWGQLVTTNNIALYKLEANAEISLSPNISITAFTVPHRDEYSETVGYRIKGPTKTILFIPDIDKWEKWETNIIEEITRVDIALIDGSFYNGEEINNRDISEIPHPFVIESMELFHKLPVTEKAKIHFIHFNHTNPMLNASSPQTKEVLDSGYQIAVFKQLFKL